MKKLTFLWLSVKSLVSNQVLRYTGKIKVFNLFIFTFSLLFIGCSKESLDISKPTPLSGNTTKSAVTCETPLIAAQNYTAGTVTSTFNLAGNQLTISYSTLGTDYCLVETHLDLQADPANFPQTKNGNPKVGQFAYGATLGCETGWTQVVDLTTITGWLPGAYVYIAAHAVVKINLDQEETAWGQGLDFPGNNWAMYFSCQQPVFTCGNPFTDSRDGKTYNTVQIGTQCWFAQNLNVGIKINGSEDQTNNPSNPIIEKYCYNDLESNCDIYGGLYQWNEMMQYLTTEGVQGICPTGWHLPTDAMWTTLTNYLGGESVAGGKMKSTGTIEASTGLWYSPNTGATNESGFTALPAGERSYDGKFYNIDWLGIWWSSSDPYTSFPWVRYMNYYSSKAFGNGFDKNFGLSVRCLKDN